MARRGLIAAVVGGVLPGSLVALIAAAGSLWGGSASPTFALDRLPEETVRQYHFAESHPELTKQIPCYCGCYGLGHTNLLDCFIRPQGGYERHASECGICGREAEDVSRMLEQGADPQTIRAAIDAAYSGYGKPTDTPGTLK